MFNERRSDGRQGMAAPELSCDRGTIVDFSASGMRLTRRWPWPVGWRRRTSLTPPDSEPLTLRATCVWSNRTGSGDDRYTIGLAFDQLDDVENCRLHEFVRNYGGVMNIGDETVHDLGVDGDGDGDATDSTQAA